MKNFIRTVVWGLSLVAAGLGGWLIMRTLLPTTGISPPDSPPSSETFVGSASCRECHEDFYRLWEPSHHGRALQPFSAELARTRLTAPSGNIDVEGCRYRAEFEAGRGVIRENGPAGEREYPIEYVLGGKNIYYFLSPMERGRLQVMPIAYDVHDQTWYDTTASMVRHAVHPEDDVLSWRDRLLTFNTSCYGCHVSQLSTHYDPETDSYRTTWAEPGINCETCHGGSREHVRVFREAPEGRAPDDMKIIRTSAFNHEQINSMCAVCHAKMTPLTSTFRPGDRYFDHFSLAAFENPDFHPDGRDLGENYTYTLWLTSPCVQSGSLDCMHCHTSSGRYRFQEENPNGACLPCHTEHVENASAHSRHPSDDVSSRCVSCHMPKTEFARMGRSDHSMRPPTPAVTMAYGSPNACNICHADQDAAWADGCVREWRARDFQAPVLHRAGLIDAARRRDWTRLDEMLAFLTGEGREDVFAASLIRLLRACGEERKRPVIAAMLADPSPLVRAAAAESLSGCREPETVSALSKAARDEYRLVRIRAASSLAGCPPRLQDSRFRGDVDRATSEYIESMRVRPDDFASQYNLGNFFMDRRDLSRATAAFERAIRLRPKNILPLINASIAYAGMGRSDAAEESLRRALGIEPDNPVANLNLGMLLAEQGRTREAEQVLRAALDSDSPPAAAAYNLALIVSVDRLEETIALCRRARRLDPDEPRYAYTLAFYLHQAGDRDEAVPLLERMIDGGVSDVRTYLLLGTIYEEGGRRMRAETVYRQAAADRNLSPEERAAFAAKADSLRKLDRPDPAGRLYRYPLR